MSAKSWAYIALDSRVAPSPGFGSPFASLCVTEEEKKKNKYWCDPRQTAQSRTMMKATHPTTASQRLYRLYELKKQQLDRQQHQPSSILYRVLAAEAEAISDALKKPPK